MKKVVKFKNPNGTFDEWTYENQKVVQVIIRGLPRIDNTKNNGKNSKK